MVSRGTRVPLDGKGVVTPRETGSPRRRAAPDPALPSRAPRFDSAIASGLRRKAGSDLKGRGRPQALARESLARSSLRSDADDGGNWYVFHRRLAAGSSLHRRTVVRNCLDGEERRQTGSRRLIRGQSEAFRSGLSTYWRALGTLSPGYNAKKGIAEGNFSERRSLGAPRRQCEWRQSRV